MAARQTAGFLYDADIKQMASMQDIRRCAAAAKQTISLLRGIFRRRTRKHPRRKTIDCSRADDKSLERDISQMRAQDARQCAATAEQTRPAREGYLAAETTHRGDDDIAPT